jgi:broad specificity phosphatase PhoE
MRLWLVRHGEAAAGWDAHPDPPLSNRGRQDAQRAADLLAPVGPRPLFTSPLLRTRQTAAVLAAAWNTEAVVAPEVTEVPSPPTAEPGEGAPLDARGRWLAQFLAERWTHQPDYLWHWRHTLIGFLAGLTEPCVVVTHAVAINTVLAEATGDERVFTAAVATGSVTAVEVSPDGTTSRFEVMALGVTDSSTTIG